jgi:hypothetical protein
MGKSSISEYLFPIIMIMVFVSGFYFRATYDITTIQSSIQQKTIVKNVITILNFSISTFAIYWNALSQLYTV